MMRLNKKRIFILVLSIVLTCISVSYAGENDGLIDNFCEQRKYTAGVFKDINSSDWYSAYVSRAYELSLTEGSNGKFLPNGKLTVAETITFAARIHSIYTNDKYSFKKTTPWYQSYIDYALENGIVLENEFNDYSKNITRAEFAGILDRSLPDEVLPKVNEIVFSAIPDVDICDKYGEAIYHLYECGIVAGNDDIGTFHPNNNISRAEAIAIIVRMVDKQQRVSVTLSEAPVVTNDLQYTTLFNIKSVYWLGTSFPVDLGLPKLTDEEIAYLIEKHDYRYAAQAITTYADAANFLKQIGMDGEYGYVSLYNSGQYFWSMSACQAMDLKSGGCTVMSGAIHYLLKDNFEELLYCHVSDAGPGSHMMLIIKANNKYYLTNPADLDIDGNWDVRWFEGRNPGYILVADDIQTIADGIVNSNMGITVVNTYESPGDFFIQSRSDINSEIWIYPTGTEVHNWTGQGVEYQTFDCNPMPVPDWTTGEYYIDAKYIKLKDVNEDTLAYINYKGTTHQPNTTLTVSNGETLYIQKRGDYSGPTKIYTYTISDPSILECTKLPDGSLKCNIKNNGTVTLTLTKYGHDIVYTINCRQ